MIVSNVSVAIRQDNESDQMVSLTQEVDAVNAPMGITLVTSGFTLTTKHDAEMFIQALKEHFEVMRFKAQPSRMTQFPSDK